MDVSIFKVAGPVMIGPSSSHTAGAARLGRIARVIAAGPFSRVEFGLHGSFARTYKGHGTDRALVAGVLGFREDDERLADSFALAGEAGISFRFYETELEGMHENSVRITFYMDDGSVSEVIGSSIGGGQIVIRRINGFDTSFSAQMPTLVISQNDRRGVVSAITGILAHNGMNIAVMKLSRNGKGETACCVIETDDEIPAGVLEALRQVENVISVQAINVT